MNIDLVDMTVSHMSRSADHIIITIGLIKAQHFNIPHLSEHPLPDMLVALILLCTLHKTVHADIATEDVQFLNELPLDKLLRLKNSLQELITIDYENVTTTTPSYLENFGAQAMAIKAAPIKRGDYEEVYKKDHHSKISNIFSMSVTTLAFLAFGGYLLCLIVQAVKSKQMYYNTPTVSPGTFLVSAGIKKRPQAQFSTYGRRRKDDREARSLRQVELPTEQLFSALLQLCEGYAKWSELY